MSKAKAASPSIDLSGLDDVMTGQAAEHASNYRVIDLDHVHPDPAQPRREMDLVSLEEMARSMSAVDANGTPRGVRQPISVRPDPDNDGHYLINYGHRRHRAAGMAELTAIPAIVQDDSTFTDQLLENIQREDLSPTDISHAIARLMDDEGMTMGAIGNVLGKSKDWVSLHSQFGRADDKIKALFHDGIIGDVRNVVELERARAKDPESINPLIRELAKREQTISRNELLARIATATGKEKANAPQPQASTQQHDSQGPDTAPNPNADDEAETTPTQPPAKPSSAAQPPTGDTEGDADSSVEGQGDPLSDNSSDKAGSEAGKHAVSTETVTPPESTRRAGVCISVQWMEGDDPFYGQLIQEPHTDERLAQVYGDDGETRTIEVRELRLVALSPA